MNRSFGRDDAAGVASAAAGVDDLRVLLDPVDTFDNHAILIAQDADDFAFGALVLAGDHLDGVALLQVDRALLGHHKTSGASEMIFMNFLSRNSRPTGPKMRVPRGSPSLFKITAAFSSKRM